MDINGVKIEATEAEVIQKLGKPSSRKSIVSDNECREEGRAVILRYPGLLIELEGSGGVAATTVTSPKWFFSGIKIGASISQVQKKFGVSKARREKGLDYLNYLIGDGEAEFTFQKAKLVKIYWEFNFC